LHAHITFLQAAQAAGEYQEWEQQMLLLANGLIAGDKACISRHRKLKLILELRSAINQRPDHIPTGLNQDFAAFVDKEFLYYLLVYRPRLGDVRHCLATISGLHCSDRAFLESQIAGARGLNAEALEFAEQALASFEKGGPAPGTGQHRPVLLLAAFKSSLMLVTHREGHQPLESNHVGLASNNPGQRGAIEERYIPIRQLLDAAWQEIEEEPCANCEKNVLRSEIRWQLAVDQSIEKLRVRVARFLDYSARIEAISQTEFLVLKAWLLDSDLGDPCDLAHPSREGLSRRSPSDQGLSDIYDRAVAVLCYRLACLRYSVGVPPVDDVYYQKPQRFPDGQCLSDADEVRRRLYKARVAVRWAMRWAVHLDALLECDWRQLEVQAHSERIEEIALTII
jgi:hypothetical protein